MTYGRELRPKKQVDSDAQGRRSVAPLLVR